MAKYLVLSSFTGQAIRRFAAKPPDQAAAVRSLAESAGGSPECHCRMSGQDDAMGIVGQPGPRTMAAVSPAAAGSGAFTRLETHELIEASDLTAIAGRAQGTAYQPPGT
jgi:uncharacterized protein with GYD domain